MTLLWRTFSPISEEARPCDSLKDCDDSFTDQSEEDRKTGAKLVEQMFRLAAEIWGRKLRTAKTHIREIARLR